MGANLPDPMLLRAIDRAAERGDVEILAERFETLDVNAAAAACQQRFRTQMRIGWFLIGVSAALSVGAVTAALRGDMPWLVTVALVVGLATATKSATDAAQRWSRRALALHATAIAQALDDRS